MPEMKTAEHWNDAMWRHEFGEDASAVQNFIAAHQKRGTKPDEPKKDYYTTIGAVFNAAIMAHLRTSLWQPLEQARTRAGLTPQQLADALRVVPSTYSKIQAGRTNLESVLLFLRPLGVDMRDLPVPSHSELTTAGLVTVVPLVRDEVLGSKQLPTERKQKLTAEDVEWLLHLDVCEEIWLTAFLRKDEKIGSVLAACLAASIGIRLNRSVEPRPFSTLVDFWKRWFKAWEICMNAIPTGRMV